MIKLAYIILSEKIAGTEIHVLNLVKGIQSDSSFEVTVICGGGILADAFRNLNIRVIEVKTSNKYDCRTGMKLYQILKKGKYDVVHTHLGISGLLGRIAAKLAGIKIILMTEHSWCMYNDEYSFFTNKVHLFAYALLANITNKIIAVSNSVRSFLIEEIGISSNKVVLIHNALDFSAFKKEEKSVRKYQGRRRKRTFIIGVIGRLEKEKGHVYLLEAIKLLNRKDVFLWIVGDGTLKEFYGEKCRQWLIEDQVFFYGYMDNRKIGSLYRNIDILVVPSLRETFGLVVLEGMFYKKPCIVTEIGGLKEIVVDRINGLLVKEGSAASLKKAITELLEDDNLREKIAQKGYETVSKYYKFETMIKEIKMLYLKEFERIKSKN